MGWVANAATGRAAMVLAGVLLTLAVPAAADATVTSTVITAPADPYYAIAGSSQPQTITVTGTATGTGSVDLACYFDNGSTGTDATTIVSGVAVANGTFSRTLTLADLNNSDGVCRLRAVPAGTTPTTGLASFAGPRAFVGYFGSSSQDEELQVGQPEAINHFSSFGSCAFGTTQLYDPTTVGDEDANGFQCADQVQNPSASSSSRPGLVIDGSAAYPPSEASQLSGPPSGVPSLTVDSLTQDASDGDTTLVETDPLVHCSSTACTSSGVQVQRTTLLTDAGRATEVTDTYSSTDGASHTVNVLAQFPFSANSGALAYEFSGQSAFAAHAAGDLVTVPATGAQSLFIKNTSDPDGSTAAAVGQVTYGQAPSDPFAFSGPDAFDAANTITVPATGSVTLRYARSTANSLATVQQAAAAARAAFDNAQVAFTSPANGATVSSSPVTVTGTVSATSGVRSVTVNGVAATVSGGSFLASVPLIPGTNTLTAQVTSGNGLTGSASESVTDTPVPVSVTEAPGVVTELASAVKATRATLNGVAVGGTPAGTFAFQYGTTTTFGRTAPQDPLAAGTAPIARGQTITGLTPGTLYHFRLTATNAAGTATGAGATFRTPKARPSQLTASVSPGQARSAPYRYRLTGRLVAGVTARGVCAGAVSVSVAEGSRTLLRRRATVSARCRYATTLVLGAGALPGNGTLTVAARFDGNSRLSTLSAPAAHVRFG